MTALWEIDIREINTFTILLRILLALIVGGIIGIERCRKNQPAGFRTYMLVCLGAALVMMTNQYIFMNFGGKGDIARLGAQVISGIGFLGAGSIMVTRKNKVRGVTTAAGLWIAGCMGLAIGIGFYEGAILVGVAVFMIMTVFQKIETRFRLHSRSIGIYLNLESLDVVHQFLDYCRDEKHKVDDMEISKSKTPEGQMIVMMVALTLRKGVSHITFIENVSKLEGIIGIEEI